LCLAKAATAGAYPRMRGGTKLREWHRLRNTGLSPHARGNRRTLLWAKVP